MRQLSELDSSFLYLETENTPMHLGGIYFFEGEARTSALTFETFRTYLESRLHVARFFRQRLLEVPLRLDRPYWIDDANFDIDRHIHYVTLNNERNETELMALAEQILQQPLARDRPLWEITFVDGFDDTTEPPSRSFALIVKVHHAAIDAFSGEEVMGALLEYSASPRHIVAPQPWSPAAEPTRTRLLTQAYANVLQTPIRLASLARDSAAAAFHTLLLQRIRELNLPLALFNAPRSTLNSNVTPRRKLVTTTISLARLKSLRNLLGDVTLNDVVLGICAETLRRYLSARNAMPTAPLIALTPVSVRSKSLRSPTGNQMSALMLSLATDEKNPALRVRLIHQNAIITENYQQAIAADRLTELVPSTLLALSARLYSEFQLAQRHKPMFNLPITNVPGPQAPLYLQGARLNRQINSSPLLDGMGVVIVAVSYLGDMTFNFTLCPDIITDSDQLDQLLQDSVNAIEAAALILEAEGGSSSVQSPLLQTSNGGALLDGIANLVDAMIGSVRKRIGGSRHDDICEPLTTTPDNENSEVS